MSSLRLLRNAALLLAFGIATLNPQSLRAAGPQCPSCGDCRCCGCTGCSKGALGSCKCTNCE